MGDYTCDCGKINGKDANIDWFEEHMRVVATVLIDDLPLRCSDAVNEDRHHNWHGEAGQPKIKPHACRPNTDSKKENRRP